MVQNYIYIVFSATPYLMGKMIRRITGETYNHVSIALDEELTQMYGFARRHFRTPLYGGFVKESHARYHFNGKSTQICLCKLPVTQEQYTALQDNLTTMQQQEKDYLYNHISAMGALIHKPIPAKNAYTCIEFCVQILHDAGVDIDPKKYYSVGNVAKMLEQFVIYTGPMPNNGEEDPAFFAKQSALPSAWRTVRDICKLVPRIFTKKSADG